MVAVAGRDRRGGGARSGEVPAAGRRSPRRVWLTARRRTRLELLGHRAGLAGQQRQPVVAVAPVGELAQRVGERVGVGEVGERERFGQHRRELRRMVVQPASQPRGRGPRRGRPRVPVQQVAEREQVTQVDRRVELRRRRASAAARRRAARRSGAGRASAASPRGRRIGARELARGTARARGDARSVSGRTAAPRAVAGPAVAQGDPWVPCRSSGSGGPAARGGATQTTLQPSCQRSSQAPFSRRQSRAEPRAADQHLVCLSGGCERERPATRWRGANARPANRESSIRSSRRRGRCRSRTRRAASWSGESQTP